MKKKDFEKGQEVAEKILNLLQKEIPDFGEKNLDVLMMSLEAVVASVIKNVINGGLLNERNDEAVDFFCEHIKRFIKASS